MHAVPGTPRQSAIYKNQVPTQRPTQQSTLSPQRPQRPKNSNEQTLPPPLSRNGWQNRRPPPHSSRILSYRPLGRRRCLRRSRPALEPRRLLRPYEQALNLDIHPLTLSPRRRKRRLPRKRYRRIRARLRPQMERLRRIHPRPAAGQIRFLRRAAQPHGRRGCDRSSQIRT